MAGGVDGADLVQVVEVEVEGVKVSYRDRNFTLITRLLQFRVTPILKYFIDVSFA